MKSHKNLPKESRLRHAKKFLCNNPQPIDLIQWYKNKYKISATDAEYELYEIGYYDDIKIQKITADGGDYEYMVDPLSGDMKVVPKGTSESDLYLH